PNWTWMVWLPAPTPVRIRLVAWLSQLELVSPPASLLSKAKSVPTAGVASTPSTRMTTEQYEVPEQADSAAKSISSVAVKPSGTVMLVVAPARSTRPPEVLAELLPTAWAKGVGTNPPPPPLAAM